MPNICIICHRTSRKFKDINFIPFPKKFEIREKWLKALKLTENDLKASSRVCSFHFFGGERKKNDVPSLEIGEKFGAKSGRKNPKDKMRQYEKNQVKQDGKKINNTSLKSPHPENTSLLVSEFKITLDFLTVNLPKKVKINKQKKSSTVHYCLIQL